MQDGDYCQPKARTLISLASCGRMLTAFAAFVPCVLLLLTYHGCVPSENSYRWSDHTLQRAKGYIEQIRWDLKHVQNLKTNMEYLRRSKEDEERQREIKRLMKQKEMRMAFGPRSPQSAAVESPKFLMRKLTLSSEAELLNHLQKEKTMGNQQRKV